MKLVKTNNNYFYIEENCLGETNIYDCNMHRINTTNTEQQAIDFIKMIVSGK